MTKSFLGVIEFPTVAGDPIDWSHNQFAFSAPDGTLASDAADAIHAALDDFYNTQRAGAGTSIAENLSSVVDRGAGAAPIRVYDLTGHEAGTTPVGPPVAIRTITVRANTYTESWPNGVAVAVSFHSAYGSDAEFGPGRTTRPRARDRGRVYIGPLNAASGYQDAHGRLSFGAGADFADAGLRLMTGPWGTLQWCVWSRASAALKRVVSGFVDDRFDYQRRREDQGLSTARTTW